MLEYLSSLFSVLATLNERKRSGRALGQAATEAETYGPFGGQQTCGRDRGHGLGLCPWLRPVIRSGVAKGAQIIGRRLQPDALRQSREGMWLWGLNSPRRGVQKVKVENQDRDP